MHKMHKWKKLIFDFLFSRRGKDLKFESDNKSRYWQITIIARDDETNPRSGGYLSAPLIEQGIKLNRLPLFLNIEDVEAMEIGDKPITIHPLPEHIQ